MAFCPNCGTPNTDQAEKCVSCGFELATKQKNKFKGTMMMSGIKVPGQPQPNQPAASPPPAAGTPSNVAPAPAPPSEAPPPAGDRNMAFQKTMLGHAAVVPPTARPRPEPSGATPSDFEHAPTIQGSGPALSGGVKEAAGHGQPSVQAQSAVPAGSRSAASGFSANASSSSTGDFGGRASTGDAIDSSFPGGVSKPNPGKILAIGCAALLVLFCVVSGILWATLGAKLKSMMSGGDTGAEAAAWQASIAQSLAQVAALCQNDCQQASVFFHPNSQAALLDEGKALTEARIQKLSDPESSKAEMLDGTEDDDIATKLGLDPQQCARVIAGAAKVVSCSVPEPGGKPSVLRIVHLSGVKSL
jgi:hypothetical protein